MNDAIQALVLALLQGLTEFLPISSSAHLIIPSLVLGWEDQGMAFDVAVHIGTLTAVILYYRRDLGAMAAAFLVPSAHGAADQRRLVLMLALATVPAVVVGFTGDDYIETHLRTLPVMATTTLVFGLLLGLADCQAGRRSAVMGWRIALVIGLAQALALVPGVSRSGVTITAALMLGLSRHEAARFSFLLSIPVIAGAGLLKGLDLAGGELGIDCLWTALAALVAGLTAYLSIHWFIALLDRVGLMPFVYYRVALALVLYAIWVT